MSLKKFITEYMYYAPVLNSKTSRATSVWDESIECYAGKHTYWKSFWLYAWQKIYWNLTYVMRRGRKKFLSSNIWIKDEESKLWTLTFTRSTKRICAIERACPYDNKWAAILKLIRKPKPTRNADEIGDTWDEDWCKYYVEVLIRAATNHLWRLLEDSWRKRDLTVAAQWEMLLLRSEIA